ncbi:hypothetical protein Tco_0835471, partial [Tanacetum coccineum]
MEPLRPDWLTSVSCLLASYCLLVNAEEEELQTSLSSEKIIFSSLEEPISKRSFPEQEEETRTVDRMASPSLQDVQNDNLSPNDAMSETRDDNPVIGHIDGDDSHPVNSKTTWIKNLALGETFKRNADSFSKPHVGSLNGGAHYDVNMEFGFRSGKSGSNFTAPLPKVLRRDIPRG